MEVDGRLSSSSSLPPLHDCRFTGCSLARDACHHIVFTYGRYFNSHSHFMCHAVRTHFCMCSVIPIAGGLLDFCSRSAFPHPPNPPTFPQKLRFFLDRGSIRAHGRNAIKECRIQRGFCSPFVLQFCSENLTGPAHSLGALAKALQ